MACDAVMPFLEASRTNWLSRMKIGPYEVAEFKKLGAAVALSVNGIGRSA